MNQYSAIEEQPVLETPKKSSATSIKKLVAVSVSGGITVASMSGNAKIEAGSCGKPTTKTGTITGTAAITGTGC